MGRSQLEVLSIRISHPHLLHTPRNASGKEILQGDIEKRTGLLRCHISRVENGHTVPAIETLEKLARADSSPTSFSLNS
jgi:transcriptional regulator with XRE-family HTH domain